MKIFLSYAKNDSEIAKRLYGDLKQAGFEPWDEDDILPGQKKEFEIKNAIEKGASHFLVLLSSYSVSRRSLVLKHLKWAMETLDEFPQDEIFIIPARLDDCEISDPKFQQLQYVDLFPSYENGFDKILKSLGLKQSDQKKESDSDRTEETGDESSNRDQSQKNNQTEGKDTSHRQKNSGENQASTPKSEAESQKHSMMYAFISLIAIAIGAGLLFLFIVKADDLIAQGIDAKVFYILLIPLGLCAAAFLFGAMSSYASYQGNVIDGRLRLGGPAVLFVLVVIGGFRLVPDTSSFDITVFVHGPKGQLDLVLKNTGEVMIDLGGDRRTEKIGAKGEASFHSIPANFRNQPISVAVIAEGFEPAKPDQKYELKGKSVYVEVKKDEVQEILKKEDFVFVPSGSLDMGCINEDTECEDNEKPPHKVSVNGFWIGKFEVTQGQWKEIMGKNPSLKCKDCPVTASWNDIQSFIFKLNQKTGKKYRLPTEAEWEFACRSGGKNDRYSGGDASNSQDSIHPVGKKKPNDLGLYDMSGNVWEWCEDVYCPDAYNCREKERVIRGGSWRYSAINSRCTSRRGQSAVQTSDDIGFRLVMEE